MSWAVIHPRDGREVPNYETQGNLLREIFGNPFRPIAVDPAWRTSTVQLLAQGIYKERAFDRMPILADALQDAGCDCDDILNHLRDANAVGGQGAEAPAPHVRGCWALDLVLASKTVKPAVPWVREVHHAQIITARYATA